MNWLSSLPHQIPFRAASTGRRIDDKTIEGEYLCAAGDPELFVAEAMAQLAGGLVFDPAQHGFLSGVDRFEVDRAVVAGDVVRIVVHLDAELGGLFRFTASGSIDGVEVARGRFYLASPEHSVILSRPSSLSLLRTGSDGEGSRNAEIRRFAQDDEISHEKP